VRVRCLTDEDKGGLEVFSEIGREKIHTYVRQGRLKGSWSGSSQRGELERTGRSCLWLRHTLNKKLLLFNFLGRGEG